MLVVQGGPTPPVIRRGKITQVISTYRSCIFWRHIGWWKFTDINLTNRLYGENIGYFHFKFVLFCEEMSMAFAQIWIHVGNRVKHNKTKCKGIGIYILQKTPVAWRKKRFARYSFSMCLSHSPVAPNLSAATTIIHNSGTYWDVHGT